MFLVLRHILIALANVMISFRMMVWYVITKIFTYYKLRVLPNEGIVFNVKGDIPAIIYHNAHLLKFKKSFEYKTLELYKNLLKKGDIVLDIGANIGLFSVLGARQIGEEGKIFAFEPSSDTFRLLKDNLNTNNVSTVVPLQLALSDKPGELYLVKPKDVKKMFSSSDAFNYLQTNNAIAAPDDGEKVTVETLDDIIQLKGIKKVDLIKIDIEGAELFCFKGATKLLSSANPPIIIFECNEAYCKRFGYKVYDLLSFLTSYGYELEQYEHEQWLATPKTKK